NIDLQHFARLDALDRNRAAQNVRSRPAGGVFIDLVYVRGQPLCRHRIVGMRRHRVDDQLLAALDFEHRRKSCVEETEMDGFRRWFEVYHAVLVFSGFDEVARPSAAADLRWRRTRGAVSRAKRRMKATPSKSVSSPGLMRLKPAATAINRSITVWCVTL